MLPAGGALGLHAIPGILALHDLIAEWAGEIEAHFDSPIEMLWAVALVFFQEIVNTVDTF